MHYTVRALDAVQQVCTLHVEALDEADALEQARGRRLVPLSATRRFMGARREPFALLLFAQELCALVAAGLGVVEALDALLEKESHASRRTVLQRLATGLRQGQRLSSALRDQPGVFPPLFVGLVQAAEGTSDIPRALRRYVGYETRLLQVKHQVASAAVYPAILLAVGTAVSLFLLGYVVPRFAAVYQGTGRPLPWASQLLLQWGDFAQRHGGWLALAAALLAAALWHAWRGRRETGWLALVALLPAATPRLRVLRLSRLYLTLGMLVEGGIPLHQALRLCEGLDAAGLAAVRRDIESGLGLADAFERHGFCTPVSLRLLRAGERSGQLAHMLEQAALFHEQEASRWIERFSKAFEPVLMAAIGLVIGLIVILLYLPVFDLAGSLP